MVILGSSECHYVIATCAVQCFWGEPVTYNGMTFEYMLHLSSVRGEWMLRSLFLKDVLDALT